MKRHRTPRLSLMMTGVLILLGTNCVVGIAGVDCVSNDRMSAEMEEAKELLELDDTDHLLAIHSHEVTLAQADRVDEWLQAEQIGGVRQLAFGLDSCGPPTA